jgi:hypothetical protein
MAISPLAPTAGAATPKATAPGRVVVSDGHTPKVVTGDFNGDGKTDLATTGVQGWDSIAVAFSTGGGQFNSTALATSSFPQLAATPGAQIVTGDFNKDGKSDIALTGVPGWDSIPVAFSTGGGQFNVTALSSPGIPGLAALPGVKVLPGDFNDDGMTDLALTGGQGWDSIPVAFSTGGGQFTFTATPVNPTQDPDKMWPQWASTPGAQVVTGDFDNDGRTDLAMTGVPGLGRVPVALSTGAGGFTVADAASTLFASDAAAIGAQLLTGDFNADGRTDLALTGGQGWDSIPVAFSTGGGQFNVTALSTGFFPQLAAQPGAEATTGDFNADGKSDLALAGGQGWDSIPVAFSTGGGQFNSTALTTPLFPGVTGLSAPAGGGVYQWNCLPHPSKPPLAPGPDATCPSGATAAAGLSHGVRQVAVGKAKVKATRITLDTTHIGTAPGDPTSTNQLADIVAKKSTFSMALLTDGTVETWGDTNEEGQLGDGTTTAHHAPAVVPGLHDVVQIAAGHNFALALKTDGTVWAWGKNDFSELGMGAFGGLPVTTPERIRGLDDIVQVSASDYGGYALHSDGTVSMWGVPSLSDFTTTLQLQILEQDATELPALLSSDAAGDPLTGVTQISAGYWHFLAAQADGSVWGLGNNQFGQSGAAGGSRAQKVAKLPAPVTKLSAGDTQSIAIAGPGHTVFAWGDALVDEGFQPLDEGGHYTVGHAGFYLYQTATREIDPSTTPSTVQVPKPAVDISADFDTWSALLSDGSVWTWHPELTGNLPGGDENHDLAAVSVPANAGLTQLVMAPMAVGPQDIDGTVIRPLAIGKATA